MNEKFLTAEEASAALAVHGITISSRTLMDRSSAQRVPSHKINGKRRFLLSELIPHLTQPSSHESR
jgi:hypothetical protein